MCCTPLEYPKTPCSIVESSLNNLEVRAIQGRTERFLTHAYIFPFLFGVYGDGSHMNIPF